MGESGGSEVVSECCRRMEESVRVELEGKLLALELKMEASVRDMKEYADQLKECINLRDEKLIVKEQEIENRNETIANMKEQMISDKVKITELTATVESLQEQLDGRTNSKIRATKKKSVVAITTSERLFQADTFEKFFTIKLTSNSKRTICPFKFERGLIQNLGGSPLSISKGGKDAYLVEVRNKSQSEKILCVSEIDGKPCTVRPHTLFNDTKGLIYIHNSEIDDFQSFKDGLCHEYRFRDVVQAHWIKTRQNSQAFIVVINESVICPSYPHPCHRRIHSDKSVPISRFTSTL